MSMNATEALIYARDELVDAVSEIHKTRRLRDRRNEDQAFAEARTWSDIVLALTASAALEHQTHPAMSVKA